MYKVELRKTRRIRRKLGIRQKISGTTERPRLTVFRSNKFIYAQISDDTKGVTLVSGTGNKNMESAFEVGKELAKKAKELKIEAVVFDRNGYRFHGRVQKLAEGAKEGGLQLWKNP